MATECSPPGRWSFERLANHRLVRLEGAVNLPVRVRSWESPESHVAGSRCSRVTGGGEAVYPFPRRRGKPAVRTITGILQRRHVNPKGTRESRASQQKRRPRKRRRFWRCRLEELPGVWGTECRESWQRNKGDLPWSKAHILRDSRYKHVNAKSGGTPREKSEGEIVPSMARTTEPRRREAPLLQPCPAGR